MCGCISCSHFLSCTADGGCPVFADRMGRGKGFYDFFAFFGVKIFLFLKIFVYLHFQTEEKNESQDCNKNI
jgi:hypothetical protein